MAIKAFHISAFLFAFRAAAFNLYPTVNPDSLAKSFGISVDCLDALNETVSCDQTLFQMSNTVDSYLWTTENVTNLCTPDCVKSTADWWSDVQDRCTMDNIAAYGKMIPAESIAGRFFDGLSIACLQPSSNSSSPTPTGSAPSPNNTSSSTGPAPYSNSSSASNMTSSGSSWCLIESQEWVGSDIIRPDCSTNSTEPSCLEPSEIAPENERIANLYPNDMLCSECFIKMFHQRMSSPYLPDSDYSDYLVGQYQDILDVCNATMPELIIRDIPFYVDARVAVGAVSSNSPTMPAFSPNGTQHINGTNTTSACTGQTMQMADVSDTAFFNRNVSFCDVLSTEYSVTTGDLRAVMGNSLCMPEYMSYCVPASCTLTRVSAGATCESISSANSITTLQFRNWNPNINGLCDRLLEGDYVCTGAPGGSYVPPSLTNAPTNVTAQQPGGNGTGVSSNSTAPYENSTAPTNTTPSPPSGSSGSGPPAAPSPTQKGISTSCGKYSQAKQGEYCSTFAQANNISPAQLYTLNGALGNAGENCNTAFWSGYYYCVASSAAPALATQSSTADSIPTSTSTSTLSPIAIALSTVMSTIVSTVDATAPCTSTSTSTSTSTPNPIATPVIANNAAPLPTPMQQGVSSLCAKYAQTQQGDTCASFAAANGIQPMDLYERNTALGTQGENCGTQFWGGYYYCVGGTD